jgi:hypothetical protein
VRERVADWYVKQWASATRWRFWPNLAIAGFCGGCNLWAASDGWSGWLGLMMPFVIYNFVQVAVHVRAAFEDGHPWKEWEYPE